MNGFKGLIVSAALLFGSYGLLAQVPGWAWAAQAGGSGYDHVSGIATDSQGNQYITGFFSGTATFGSFTLITSGDYDIFIGKLDTDGNFLWAVNAGGTMDDRAYAINTDTAANVYLTGYYRGTASFGTIEITSNGMEEVFVAKLSSDGNFIWAVNAGGAGRDAGYGIAVDISANVYLTGEFHGTASFGSHSITAMGWYYDIFTAKLDSNGNWIWAASAGGSYPDQGNGICIDSSGNCIVTGYFEGNASFGSITLNGIGNTEIFVAKYNSAGNLLWARRAGGIFLDRGISVAVDGEGNLYATGYFNGSADFGVDTLVNPGNNDDVFIAKLDPSGNWLWARNAGGPHRDDVGTAIAVDAIGNCLVTGYFYLGADFGPFHLNAASELDIFVVKLDPSGAWIWAKRAGWTSDDSCYGIALDPGGEIYLAGTFWGETRFGDISMTSSGGFDNFIAKLSYDVPVDEDLAPEIPGASCLYDAYPNPIPRGKTATIKAFVADRQTGTLTIYNLRGQVVSRFQLDPGTQQISLDSRSLSSGIYLCQLKTQSVNTVKKLVLLK